MTSQHELWPALEKFSHSWHVALTGSYILPLFSPPVLWPPAEAFQWPNPNRSQNAREPMMKRKRADNRISMREGPVELQFPGQRVQFSYSVVSDSLWPHGLQHVWPPCQSPTPGACSNSCPLSRWWINHLILCCPLLLPPSIFLSIRVFSNESVLIRWPKYWSFSFNISPSNEHLRMISFRMDWLDLLAVQGILKSLLQHHSSKASILWCSAFFIVQLSPLYMIGKKQLWLDGPLLAK